MTFEPRTCKYCGRTFIPTHPNNQLCSVECKRARRRITQLEWQQENAFKYADQKRDYMRRYREGATTKPDTIIGEGYAERQIAKTLSMVPKINTEL